MKNKDDILHMLKCIEVNPDMISTADHQRMELLIEVIVDIRDILNDRLNFIYRLFVEIRDHK